MLRLFLGIEDQTFLGKLNKKKKKKKKREREREKERKRKKGNPIVGENEVKGARGILKVQEM